MELLNIGMIFAGVTAATVSLPMAENECEIANKNAIKVTNKSSSILDEELEKIISGTKGTAKAETGGKLLSVEEYLKRDAEAEKMYDIIKSYTTDVKRISENTGIPESRINRIKEHVFYNEHIKTYEVGRFDPNYDMANSWERLIRGDYVQSDIDLLNHEIFESKFESIFKTDYTTAHSKTESTGRVWNP